MTIRIINADVMAGLAQLDEESVHCVVTSPPYWGLRDYGVPGQIGLEPTLGEHIAKLVEVFREVRRVLRKDGTLWLNYGDAYANDGKWGGATSGKHVAGLHGATGVGRTKRVTGLKPKDLLMMPERLAIALQDDGWYVRARIIWHKPNPMPESVTDRPTKSHEHIWLMSRSPKYFYDADAIKEPSSPDSHARAARGRSETHKYADGGPGNQTIAKKAPSAGTYRAPGVNPKAASAALDGPRSKQNASFAAAVSELVPYRNARDVWSIGSDPFSEAHFATFPPELAERCIKAGCPSGGTVLDPFGGSGTTGLVADRLQRDAVLIELNPAYAEMARKRCLGDAPLFAEVTP